MHNSDYVLEDNALEPPKEIVEAVFGPWPARRYADYHLELDRKARDPEWKPLIRYGKFRDNVKVPKIQPPSLGEKLAMLLRIGLLLAAMSL